jgi:hypothetical protein
MNWWDKECIQYCILISVGEPPGLSFNIRRKSTFHSLCWKESSNDQYWHPLRCSQETCQIMSPPPQTIFGSTLGWIFLRDRNKIGSIDFQFTVNLLSIYFQLIFNWFQLIFNWFQLISTYFQWIFNWFQFTINWFQFTFNWFSIDVNLLAIDLQLISIWSEISLNWISTCFQLTSHSNPIEIS